MLLTNEEKCALQGILLDNLEDCSEEKRVEIDGLLRKLKRLDVIDLHIQPIPNFEQATLDERVQMCSSYAEYLRSIIDDAKEVGVSSKVEELYILNQQQIARNMIDIENDIAESKLK